MVEPSFREMNWLLRKVRTQPIMVMGWPSGVVVRTDFIFVLFIVAAGLLDGQAKNGNLGWKTKWNGLMNLFSDGLGFAGRDAMHRVSTGRPISLTINYQINPIQCTNGLMDFYNRCGAGVY